MLPHQQRVIDEKIELDGKLEKLNSFLGSKLYYTLPYEEAKRLLTQSGIMKDYSDILAERIANF